MVSRLRSFVIAAGMLLGLVTTASAATCVAPSTLPFNPLDPSPQSQSVTNIGGAGFFSCDITTSVTTTSWSTSIEAQFLPSTTLLTNVLFDVTQNGVLLLNDASITSVAQIYNLLSPVIAGIPLVITWFGNIGVTPGTFGGGTAHFTLDALPIPLPPALLLFGTALAGLGFVGRNRRKQQA